MLEEQESSRYEILEEIGEGGIDPGGEKRIRIRLVAVGAVLAVTLLVGLGIGFFLVRGPGQAYSGQTAIAPEDPVPKTSERPIDHDRIKPSAERVEVKPAVVSEKVAPALKLSARLESVVLRKTVINSGYLFGYIKNTGEGPIENPRVDVVFFDKQGKSMLHAFGYSEYCLIEQGMRAPVKIVLNKYPEGYSRYESKVEAKALYINSKRMTKVGILDKKLGPKKFGSYKLQAIIRNDEKKTLKFVKALVVFFDSQDGIIAVDSRFATKKEIAPGEESTVEIRVHPPQDIPPARYELLAFSCTLD